MLFYNFLDKNALLHKCVKFVRQRKSMLRIFTTRRVVVRKCCCPIFYAVPPHHKSYADFFVAREETNPRWRRFAPLLTVRGNGAFLRIYANV